MDSSSANESARGASMLAKVLRPFGAVRAEETGSASLLTFAVFLLLVAYYFLKVVREPLILEEGGAEVKSYAAAAQAMLLVLVVRGYDALSSRMRRMPLVVTVSGTLAATILAFAALAAAGVRIGIPFYLFVGIFSLTILAQFWALANDVYSEEQGKRIFAILGIGSSTGAVVGAKLASTLFVSLRAAGLLAVAAVLVMAALGVLGLVHRRERIEHRVTESRTPARGVSAWRLVFAQRYLLLIAVMTVLLDWINSTGEHLLERTLLEQAAVEKAAGGIVDIEAYIAEFKGSYFGWFNFVGYLLQLFVASRALRYLGVRGTLFILPALSLTGYTLMAIAPVLAAIRVAKIAENSVDYSRESTARQALYLVADRDSKYNAKTLIDTFAVRAGDVCAAAMVAVAHAIGLGARPLAAVNALLVVFWIAVVLGIAREHRRRSESSDAVIATREVAAT